MASRRAHIVHSPYRRAPPVAATPVRWDQTNESSTIDELSRALPVLELLNPKTVLALAVAILARSVLGLGNEDPASFAFVRELSAAALRRHRAGRLVSDRRAEPPGVMRSPCLPAATRSPTRHCGPRATVRCVSILDAKILCRITWCAEPRCAERRSLRPHPFSCGFSAFSIVCPALGQDRDDGPWPP
jgi:hypothetical protein